MRSKLIAAAAAAAVGVSVASVAVSTTAAAPTSAASDGRARQASVRELLIDRSARLASSPRPRGHRAVRVTPPGVSGRVFGTGCAELPRLGGAGTQRGLPRLPVATAIAQVPALSKLSQAIRLAGLTKILNAAPSLTVFAPDNAAFQILGTGNLKALFSTRSDLAPVVRFHVVAGRVRAGELYRQKVLTTIAGTKLYASRAPPSYYVNNAWISCGNLRTANATVYVVNRVVIPGT